MQLTSLISKCMMVLGTMSFIVLLTMVRYDATNDLILSTWRSRIGSDFATSSWLCTNIHLYLANSRLHTCTHTTVCAIGRASGLAKGQGGYSLLGVRLACIRHQSYAIRTTSKVIHETCRTSDSRTSVVNLIVDLRHTRTCRTTSKS